MAASMHAEASGSGSNSLDNSEGQALVDSKKRKRVSKKGSTASPSSSMTRAVVGDGNAVDEELEQQLVPSADECMKLAGVIRMLDKHGVGSEKLPAEAGVPTLLDALNPSTPGWPHAIPLLEFYLDLASSSSKARLNNPSTSRANGHGANIDNSTQSASTSAIPSIATSPVESDIDHFTNTIRGVLKELKDTATARLGRKRTKPNGKPKYALHRSIGGQYDVFSSVTETMPEYDKTWQQLGDTDLLAVYPTELAEPSSAPRLGDLNGQQPMTTKRGIELQPQIEPVSFLYYDPYSSFAPTYDSSTATLSYAQSVSLRESRQSIQEWDSRPLPPLPPEELTGPVRPTLNESFASIDPALFASSDTETIQPEEMKVYLRMMEESQIIDKRLSENTQLLRALQEAQWRRLRKSELETSELEITSAKRLLESLTSLANARPRTPDIPENSSPFVSDPAISASIVQSKPRAYYGVLDKTNSKGIPDYVMVKEEHNAAKGASGLAPPELGRKNSSQGHKKSKKSSSTSTKNKSHGQNGTGSSPAVQVSDLPAAVGANVKQETSAT